MLDRRHFIRNTSFAFSGIMLGSCSSSGVSSAKAPKTNPIVEKAKNAMLSMQRAAWDMCKGRQVLLISIFREHQPKHSHFC